MSWNGSGTYTAPGASFPEVNGTTIDATRFNATITDMATGITNCLTKDGQNSPTTSLPMGGQKHTGAAVATATGQYLTWGQAAAQLGSGAKIVEGTSGGAAANSSADSLVIDAAGNVGITLRSPAANDGFILFGDEASSLVGGIQYDHTTDTLFLRAGSDTDVMAIQAGMVNINGAAIPTGVVGILDGTSTGQNPNSNVDSIVIDGTGNTGISLLGSITSIQQIRFGDTDSNAIGGFSYAHSTDTLGASAGGVAVFSATPSAVSFGIEAILADVTPTSGLAAGFRALPTIGNTATATKAGVGKCYLNTAAITVNNSVFAAGDIVSVYNNSASAFNITQGTITTMRLAGTTTVGTRALAARGLATLFFVTATEVVVSGVGVT